MTSTRFLYFIALILGLLVLAEEANARQAEDGTLRIIAFGAHPDDVECAAAGVLIKHIEMGKAVAVVDLTAGEMGSYGTVEERKKEAEAAAALMGINQRKQLNLPDGGIENNEANTLHRSKNS